MVFGNAFQITKINLFKIMTLYLFMLQPKGFKDLDLPKGQSYHARIYQCTP